MCQGTAVEAVVSCDAAQAPGWHTMGRTMPVGSTGITFLGMLH